MGRFRVYPQNSYTTKTKTRMRLQNSWKVAETLRPLILISCEQKSKIMGINIYHKEMSWSD